MVKNKKHKRLLEERQLLIRDLNSSKFSYERSILHNRLHDINLKIRNCVKDYNIIHRPSELSSVIGELKSTILKIEGNPNKTIYGTVDFIGINILIYTSEYDWLHNRKFDVKDSNLERDLKILGYRRIGRCYFSSEFNITKRNHQWKEEIGDYLKNIIKESNLSIRVTNYNDDFSLMEFIGNSFLCNIAFFIIELIPIGSLYYSKNSILVNKKISPEIVVNYFKECGLRLKSL